MSIPTSVSENQALDKNLFPEHSDMSENNVHHRRSKETPTSLTPSFSLSANVSSISQQPSYSSNGFYQPQPQHFNNGNNNSIMPMNSNSNSNSNNDGMNSNNITPQLLYVHKNENVTNESLHSFKNHNNYQPNSSQDGIQYNHESFSVPKQVYRNVSKQLCNFLIYIMTMISCVILTYSILVVFNHLQSKTETPSIIDNYSSNHNTVIKITSTESPLSWTLSRIQTITEYDIKSLSDENLQYLCAMLHNSNGISMGPVMQKWLYDEVSSRYEQVIQLPYNENLIKQFIQIQSTFQSIISRSTPNSLSNTNMVLELPYQNQKTPESSSFGNTDSLNKNKNKNVAPEPPFNNVKIWE